MKWYILDEDDNPVETDMIKSSEFFQFIDRRRVGYTEFSDGANLSTVFLGLDHNHYGGRPILFESLWFGGKFSDEMRRFELKSEAILGHKEWVQKYISVTGATVISEILNEKKVHDKDWC